MRRSLCLALAAALGFSVQASPAVLGGDIESQWNDAAASFDGVAGGAPAPAAAGSLGAGNLAADWSLPTIFGPGGAPESGSKDIPSGIGPISTDKEPGYFKGLLGGLLGIVAAPTALALEAVQGVALSPARMVKGVVQGDFLALLDPLRCVKNLALDGIWTTAGMISSATAPVWNLIKPSEATDFTYTHDRLIFKGGPMGALTSARGARASTHSWHTVFVSRDGGELSNGSRDNTYTHEFVHGVQWRDSLLNEKIDHAFVDKNDYSAAKEYLNF